MISTFFVDIISDKIDINASNIQISLPILDILNHFCNQIIDMKNNKVGILVMVIIACGIYRLLPHISNITPVGAMALAGGMYFNKRILAFIVPIITLYASDLILNNTVFASANSGFVWFSDYMITVYGAFLLTVVLGIVLTNKKASTKIIGGTLIASILFFFITNIGAWASPLSIYPKTLSGLWTAIIAGVPFFRNTMLGNVIFIPLFVAFFEYYMNGKSVFTKLEKVTA